MKKNKTLKIIISILRKIVYFFFIFSILLCLLYILGNYQLFLDNSQLMLLELLIISSFIGGIFAAYFLILNILSVTILKETANYNPEKKQIIINLIILALNIVIFTGIKTILIWLSG